MLMVFYVGFGTGILFYIIKLVMFFISTRGWLNWLWRLAHRNGLALFIFDFIFGLIISSAIHTAGAEGLTTLFVFIGFTVSSCFYVITHLSCRKGKELACAFGRSY
jgi:hypothetical protein